MHRHGGQALLRDARLPVVVRGRGCGGGVAVCRRWLSRRRRRRGLAVKWRAATVLVLGGPLVAVHGQLGGPLLLWHSLRMAQQSVLFLGCTSHAMKGHGSKGTCGCW